MRGELMAKVEVTQGDYLIKLDSGSQNVVLEVYQEKLSGTMCDIDVCYVPLDNTTVSVLENVCKEYRSKAAPRSP